MEARAHFEVGHANRSLRSTDVNTVGGKRGLFSCELLLVSFAEFRVYEINNMMYILVLQQPNLEVIRF